MTSSNIPEPWASAIVAAGLTDPRYSDDRPSLSRLAEVAGLHTTTVSRMVKGSHRADPRNVARIAATLHRDVVEVSAWVKQSRTVREPYQAPAEVDLLTDREQAAISELIRSMAASREDVTGNAEHPAPTNPAGPPPGPGFTTDRRKGRTPPGPRTPPRTATPAQRDGQDPAGRP